MWGAEADACNGLMAAETNLVVVRGGLLPTRNVVGIMATGASKLPCALQEALRLAEPVPSLGHLKALEVSLRAIEDHFVAGQRLTRHIRERSTIETHDRVRQLFIGGLKMALQANFYFTIWS